MSTLIAVFCMNTSQFYNVAKACTVKSFYQMKKRICIYVEMGGECFWVQHFCNENWCALVWITGVFFFLSIGGIIDNWKK